MTRMGGGQINVFACTPAEEAANWAVVSQTFVTLQEFITEISEGTDFFTVMCSATDTTPGYLHAKLKDADTYATGDFIIEADLVDDAGDEHVRLFLDSSGITGYSATGTWVLALVDNVPTFVDGSSLGGASDSFKVKVSGTDTTEQYLHAKFKDAFAYATGDFLVSADAVDDGGDENVRLAIDSSAISGYTGSGDMLLGLSGTTPTFFEAASVGGGSATAGTYIDISGTDINVDLTEVAGYSPGAIQLLGHTSGTWAMKTIAEWLNLLDGYVSTENQSLGHDATGDTEWQDDSDC